MKRDCPTSDVKVASRDLWLGAAVTSLFFLLWKFRIGLYLGKSAVASAHGAGGSLVIIAVWVYYSAQMLLFGAEFIKVWTNRRGLGFRVQYTAKLVTAAGRAEQGTGRNCS
jgi:membrane protein